jgi:hypothetical protein
VVQLHRNIEQIQGKGAELYVIGNGSPSFIEGFREETKYTGPIYTDPSLEVYKAAQLKRGVMKTLNPFAIGATVKAWKNGSRQVGTQGDPWQQGGVLIVAPGGEVRWQYASGHPGDRPTAQQIAAAL